MMSNEVNNDELFLSQEEVTDYIVEFKKDSDHIYGYEQEEFGICPYITFYIYHQDNEVEEIANKIIDIYEEYEHIIDKPFKLKYKHKTSTWKRLRNGKELVRSY